jgi:branched-chain amino acid transport system permease protein
MDYFAQLIVNGLHNGALYAALAYSYMLMFQVTKRPNLAHGAVFAFSGQVFTLALNLAYNIMVFTFASSLFFAGFVSAALSLLAISILAWVLVQRFATLSPNMTIVATLAFAIVLMEAVRIGADGKDFWLPPLLQTRIAVLGTGSITLLQFINITIIALMLVAGEWILIRTSVGRNIRAVAQDEKAAALCGVHAQGVITHLQVCWPCFTSATCLSEQG